MRSPRDECIELISHIKRLLQENTLEEFIKTSESFEELILLPTDVKKTLLELQERIQFLITYYSQKQVEEFGLQKQKYLEVPTKILEILRDVSNLEGKINDNSIDLGNISKVQKLVEIIDKDVDRALNTVNEVIDSLRTDIRTLKSEIKKVAFDVERKEQKTRLESIIKELNTNFVEQFTKIRDKLEKFSKIILRISLDISSKSVKDVKDIQNNEILPIALLLQMKMKEGIRSINFLEIVTGLKSITGNPTTTEVLLDLPENDRPESLSLSSLFYRYPPFEPISVKRNDGISGNLIWFIKSKNATFSSRSFLHPQKSQDFLIDGTVDFNTDPVRLERITPIDLLGPDTNYYVLLKVERPDKKTLHLKYGSYMLKKAIQKGETPQIVDNKYRNYMKSLKRKAYSATNLSYVWYCNWGLGMSTDPWDVKCPFKSYCYIGRQVSGDMCPQWSWSRRIHPKVFPAIKREFSGGVLKFKNILGSVLLGMYGRNVLVKERYYGVQMTLPGGNFPIHIEFEKDVGTRLPKTNVVGIMVNKGILESIILSIVDPEIPGNYQVSVLDEKVDFADLLLSKYYLFLNTDKGLRTYQILERKSKHIISEYEKFKERFKKELSEYFLGNNSEVIKGFIDWVIYSLSHSLGHLLLGFLSTELEINPEDLLYMVENNPNEDYVKILIAESSPIGAIDIVGAIISKFGSVENMLLKFFEKSNTLLEEHEKDLDYYSHEIELHIKSIDKKAKSGESRYEKMIDVINELRELYRSFSNVGLILDIHLFASHLLLSGEYENLVEKISENSGLNEDEKTEIKNQLFREFDDIIALVFPKYCIDGCTSCILMDRGCTEGLGQNLSTSKELVKLFIEIFFKKREFRGRGNVVLKRLLFSSVQNSLVALSPYLDTEGIRLLKTLAEKGTKIKLITTSKMISTFIEELKGSEVEVYLWDQDHDKRYLIDNTIMISTTANLNLNSDRINSFMIMPYRDSNEIETILERSKKVESL